MLPARRHLQPLSAAPAGPLDSGMRGLLAGLMLDKCPQNRGVGLDFVRNREYGHSRWLKYPAEKNKY
jgi:hypothetical protein